MVHPLLPFLAERETQRESSAERMLLYLLPLSSSGVRSGAG